MRSNTIPPRKKSRAGEGCEDVGLSIERDDAGGGELTALIFKFQTTFFSIMSKTSSIIQSVFSIDAS